MADIAIHVVGIGKQFELGEKMGHLTLRESISRFMTSNANVKREADLLWALKDVTFDVRHGEVLGVIGKNGAGKSTLLKILSRITKPTEGYVDIYGRVGSLLEVGTGFHPDLTGRENIFLNGAILGMSKKEISAKFDEIVGFAELDRFVDTPVKRYSSGMYVRLAFSVAAHLEPEILIVDEVLAVGDAIFQKKCLGKMSDVSRTGRTVIFVSHNMVAVRALCQKAILLQDGKIARDGDVNSTVEAYATLASSSNEEHRHHYRLASTKLSENTLDGLAITDLRLINSRNPSSGLSTGDGLSLEIHYACNYRIASPAFVVSISDHHNQEILRLSTMPISGFDLGGMHKRGVVRLNIDALPLVAGSYVMDVKLVRERIETLIALERVLMFDVGPADYYSSGCLMDRTKGMIVTPHSWQHEAC